MRKISVREKKKPEERKTEEEPFPEDLFGITKPKENKPKHLAAI